MPDPLTHLHIFFSFRHIICSFNVCNLREYLIDNESGISKIKWKSPASSSDCLFHFNGTTSNISTETWVFPLTLPSRSSSHNSPSLCSTILLPNYFYILFSFLHPHYHYMRLRYLHFSPESQLLFLWLLIVSYSVSPFEVLAILQLIVSSQ